MYLRKVKHFKSAIFKANLFAKIKSAESFYFCCCFQAVINFILMLMAVNSSSFYFTYFALQQSFSFLFSNDSTSKAVE